MQDSLSPTDRLELGLFGLFQFAWSAVGIVSLSGSHELHSRQAHESGMGYFFEQFADINPWLLGTLSLTYWVGGLGIFCRRLCGLWPSIVAQTVLTLMLVVYGGLAQRDMAMLGVLAMSAGILCRLMIFSRRLRPALTAESRSSANA